MVEKQKAVVENGVQKIRITAEKGYSPKEFQLRSSCYARACSGCLMGSCGLAAILCRFPKIITLICCQMVERN